MSKNPENVEFAYYYALCVKNCGDLEKAGALFKSISIAESNNQLIQLQLQSLDSLIFTVIIKILYL